MEGEGQMMSFEEFTEDVLKEIRMKLGDILPAGHPHLASVVLHDLVDDG